MQLRCTKCQQWFHTRSDLYAHEINNHFIVKCPVCAVSGTKQTTFHNKYLMMSSMFELHMDVDHKDVIYSKRNE
jgi:phage FluMu protein Com